MLPILYQSLWRDEAFSALMAFKSPVEIIKLVRQDVQPPLYYLFLHFWILLFGNTEVILRTLSVFFHFLTVFVVFLIAKRLIKSNFASFILALATFLNPFLLHYAFEVRMYTMLAFLTTLAVYLVLLKKNLLAGFVLGLSILTHNFAVFNLMAFVVWWVLVNKNSFNPIKFISFIIFPVVAILLWGSVMWHQWTLISQGFWIKPATSSLFLTSFETYARGDLFFQVKDMLYTITLILSFFAFSYWVNREQGENREEIALFSLMVFVPTFITYVISAYFIPIYQERYLITTAPMLILIIGYSLFKLIGQERLRNLIIAFVAVYLVLLVQASEEIVSKGTKPPTNWAVSQILSQAKPNDVIIPESNLNFLETKYYVQRVNGKTPVLARSTDGKVVFYLGAVLFEPQEIITELPKNKRIWQVKPDGGYQLVNQ